MRIPQSGLRIDDPAFPLLQAGLAFWGVTTGAGNALGTTFTCADLDNFPTYVGNRVKMIGGGADGQDRLMMIHAAGGIITVDAPFTNAAGAAQQIPAGQLFVILSNSGGGGGGGAGMPPTTPLWMFGVVSPAQAASTTVIDIPHLAGFQNDTFNNEFYIEVLDADGAAPEGEKRVIQDYDGGLGRFTTDAFTANVEAGDIVAIYHKAIMAIDVLARGTLDASSATVPADSTRTEGNNYFNGCLLMTTEGAVRFQPRRIVDYTGVGGIFTLDPNNSFTAASGVVDYIIIGGQTEFVPAADAVINRTPADVIGNKADTAIAVPDAVSSAMRYLKGILGALATMPTWGAEQSGTLLATGAENEILLTAETEDFELYADIDLVNMAGGDTTVIRVYKRVDGVTLRLADEQTFAGAQTILVYSIGPLKGSLALDIRVTLQQTAGVMRNYPWRWNRK